MTFWYFAIGVLIIFFIVPISILITIGYLIDKDQRRNARQQ